MKIRGTFLFSAIILLLVGVAAVLPETAPPGDKESVIIQTMMRNLERFHYQPMQIDDEFSGRAYDHYLNDMDGARLFFTHKDLGEFSPNKFTLDDQVNAGSYEFFDLVQERWITSLDKTEKWYKDILGRPIALENGGKFTVRDDDSDWSANDKALRQYWEDYIHQQAGGVRKRRKGTCQAFRLGDC